MIAIVDYGVGNLFSLVSSLKRIGADAVVTSQMLFIIKELHDTGKIKCNCDESDFMIDVGFDTIEISCDKCQSRKILRSRTDSDIIELAGVDELILE